MSDYMKIEAIKAGIDESKIVVNPLFTVEVSQPIISNDDPIKRILYIGRLSRTKGVHYLIKIAKELVTKHDNIVFDIVGDGHDADLFKSLVPDHLKKYIVFHGWQSREQISQHLRKAYLMAFTSIYPEAFGISGIEALMHGKPVVGFDVGGVSTWLKDGKNGFLVVPKKSVELEKKMIELLTNTNLYNTMSFNARQVALENFSPKFHFNQLFKLYCKIIKKKNDN
jgi:glycosyltransferase involved in cell wall biosynthesis